MAISPSQVKIGSGHMLNGNQFNNIGFFHAGDVIAEWNAQQIAKNEMKWRTIPFHFISFTSFLIPLT